MGTKNRPGEFDCYAKAEDDEPTFTLLARDIAAAPTVRSWANNLWFRTEMDLSRGKLEYQGEGHMHIIEKIDEAMDLADEMEKWRKENHE